MYLPFYGLEQATCAENTDMGNLGGETADACCGVHAYAWPASVFASGLAEGAPVAPFNVKKESQLPKYFHFRFEAAICDHDWLATYHKSI